MKGEDEAKEKVVHAIPQTQAPETTTVESIAVLFEQHHDRVYRIARRITGSAEDAEDIVQTVFLRIMRREDAPLREDDVAGYLHRAATNAAFDVLRRRAALRADSMEHEGAYADHAPSPESLRAGGEIRERLRRALADLNPRAAEIFALRYFDGYGNREIAKLLHTSWSTVAVTLHRTRAKLQKDLKGELR